MTAKCADCGLPYEKFGLDTVLFNPQWAVIAGADDLLCANCIVLRASRLDGVIAARMVIEIAPSPQPRSDWVPGSLLSLGLEANKINAKNGWHVTTLPDWTESEYKVPGILALIHSEVSEALEAFRVSDIEHFGEELADIVIRVADVAAGLKIDLDREVLRKLEANRQREYKHGGKRI